jgi:hypothetical protein
VTFVATLTIGLTFFTHVMYVIWQSKHHFITASIVCPCNQSDTPPRE